MTYRKKKSLSQERVPKKNILGIQLERWKLTRVSKKLIWIKLWFSSYGFLAIMQKYFFKAFVSPKSSAGLQVVNDRYSKLSN